MKPIDTREARDLVAPLRTELEQPGARCSKRWGLVLIGWVERLADGLDTARHELYQRDDYQRLYGALVEDYNGLIEVLAYFGITASQPMGTEGWRWRYGELEGEAPTVAEAFKAALICADCAPADPGADWPATRVAAYTSAREVSPDG